MWLRLVAPGGAGDAQAPVGVDHIAYDLPSLRALLEACAGLTAQGIVPYWCVNHGMSASLYYADADGNQMEFAVDCFPSKADCTAYWSGLEMGQNPVGVEYDPDDWLARLRAGTPEAELLAIDAGAEVSPLRGRLETLIEQVDP